MTTISGTTLAVITKEMVPEKFRDKYDWVAKDGGDKGLIDTKDEVSRFLSEAKLNLLNLKVSKEEYEQFMNDFADYAKESDKHNTEKRLNYLKEQNHIIKAKITELEKNIANFEQYKAVNPKLSATNNILNKAELWSKISISVVTLAATLLVPDGGAIGRSLVEWVDKSEKNGAIESSEYNRLRKEADYDKLKNLKSALEQNERLLSACQKHLDKLG